jgi:hypothetical protein
MTAISRRQLMRGLNALSAGAIFPAAADARVLRADDRVTVWPTLVHRAADGVLRARVEAWVFERERNPTRTRLLAGALGLDLDELPHEDRRRFEQRTALFGTDAKEGRELSARVAGGALRALPASDEQGRVSAVLPLEAVGGGHAPGWIDWALHAGTREVASRAQWIGDEGLSVVCDIDDTVKHTQVRSRRQMLLNTLAREFAAVPGMAAWLQRLGSDAGGTALHYVSGSPLQLAPPLLAFMGESGLPDGSLHLRVLSLRPASLFDAGATARHKQATIAQLLAEHPRRRFLLVGDSGERDPEVYGELARAHPQRIVAVLIRDVTGERADAARYADAFAGVPAERWRVFADPAVLPDRFG